MSYKCKICDKIIKEKIAKHLIYSYKKDGDGNKQIASEKKCCWDCYSINKKKEIER